MEENEDAESEDGEDDSEGEDVVGEESTAYAEYSHFNEWSLLDVDRECDICDETILGPYIHCKKFNDGDFDMCQGCLFQGFGCKGKDHKWLRKYPRRFCDPCGQLIQGWYWHCPICNDGYDICQTCGDDNGQQCFDQPSHDYTLIYIPLRH